MKYPHASIIIPAYNAQDTLQICLNSIMALDYPKNKIQVILVDNNSTDATQSIARRYPIIILHEKHIKSSYAARNVGIENAKGEILAFTDADCVVSPKWLSNLISQHCNLDIGCFAGKISSYKPKTLAECFADTDEENHDQFLCVTKWSYAQTANVAYRKEVFENIGLFNTNLESGGDVDFTWRMLKHGKYNIIYESDAIVYHKHRTTLKGLYLQHRKYGQGQTELAKTHPEKIVSISTLVKQFILMSLRGFALLPGNIIKYHREDMSRVDVWYDLLRSLCKLGYIDGRIRAQGLKNDGSISRLLIIKYIFLKLFLKLKVKASA